MAQLRLEYDDFAARDTAVVVVGPEDVEKFRDYFTEHDLPYFGLPDPKHSVLKLYGQQVKIFKFGRMPAEVLIDKNGIARFVHYGNSMRDIPSCAEMITLVDELNKEFADKGVSA